MLISFDLIIETPLKVICLFTNPNLAISRRLKYSVTETGKELVRRPYSPGQHGQKRAKISEYGIQLQEKQKVRFTYGVSEKQFKKTFNEAKKLQGKQGESFLFLLESRLDNLVYRAGFSKTRRQSRQLVNHGHITVNNKVVDIASFQCQINDVIGVKPKATSKNIVESNLKNVNFIDPPTHLTLDKTKLEGTVKNYCDRSEILLELNELLVIEYYSRR